jgi:hypothetical protein
MFHSTRWISSVIRKSLRSMWSCSTFLSICILSLTLTTNTISLISAAGEGMFTTGLVGFAFTDPRKLSSRADGIYAAVRAKIMQNKNNYPPGLLEQYEIQLERLENEAPGCEIISIPGFMGGPSEFLPTLSV